MSDASAAIEAGADGRRRCWWCLGAPEYVAYHDWEWGRAVRDDEWLFELLTLEAFQSGLSWLTILRKREGFRRAFDGFDVQRVAEYGEPEIERLLADPSIVRHRRKIEATITNARAARRLLEDGGTLGDLLWSFAPEPDGRPAPASAAELEAATVESRAMARELKRRGFAFVGATTAYALMEAAGLVNDHLAGCEFRDLPPVPTSASARPSRP
jgi:DNA-3-methyladenine glycosylase I